MREKLKLFGCLAIPVVLFFGSISLYYAYGQYTYKLAAPYNLGGTSWRIGDDTLKLLPDNTLKQTGKDGSGHSGVLLTGTWAQDGNEIKMHLVPNYSLRNTRTGEKSQAHENDVTYYLNGDKLEYREYFLFFYRYNPWATKD